VAAVFNIYFIHFVAPAERRSLQSHFLESVQNGEIRHSSNKAPTTTTNSDQEAKIVDFDDKLHLLKESVWNHRMFHMKHKGQTTLYDYVDSTFHESTSAAHRRAFLSIERQM
jgi:hypothetical protein